MVVHLGVGSGSGGGVLRVLRTIEFQTTQTVDTVFRKTKYCSHLALL